MLERSEGTRVTIRRSKPRPSPHAQGAVKKLRREMTFPERLLWSRLRAGRLHHLRFRRQHPMGRYVVDFYCASANLIIELDGHSHDGRLAEDQQREQELIAMGYRVFRVTHNDVIRNLDGVVEAIAAQVQMHNKSARHPPLAPPSREGD